MKKVFEYFLLLIYFNRDIQGTRLLSTSSHHYVFAIFLFWSASSSRHRLGSINGCILGIRAILVERRFVTEYFLNLEDAYMDVPKCVAWVLTRTRYVQRSYTNSNSFDEEAGVLLSIVDTVISRCQYLIPRIGVWLIFM